MLQDHAQPTDSFKGFATMQDLQPDSIDKLPRDLLNRVFAALAGENGVVLLGLAGVNRLFRDSAFEVNRDS